MLIRNERNFDFFRFPRRFVRQITDHTAAFVSLL